MLHKNAKTAHPIHELLVKRWSPRAFSGVAIDRKIIQRLFEAARWSPSASNEQPWSFMVGEMGDETYKKIFETLVEFNQLWVRTAPVAAISIGHRNSVKSGKPNDWFKYDVGQAVAHLSIQATHEGLYVHQMAGFDREKARELFNIPEDHEAISAFAIGHLGDYRLLHPNLARMEADERIRKSAGEFVFSNTFGEKSELI